ncbi:hypothetical protein CR205_15400 [Alteribacter lacisalsi]|uniref:Isoprenylcysteine carboxylmethyltransferase family protein n=1 Tax=Alteribacter lacisalsi TaxID=2045244 RepID=A0A2W0HEP3_9BACI|nr:methyltransferase [Alteribacter lacisalsi]PYZ95775.1 hypothetical protein CR205_15400 [Alteribacter lacisalsi]
MSITTALFLTGLVFWASEWFIFRESPYLKSEVFKNNLRARVLITVTFALSAASAYYLGTKTGEPMSAADSCGLLFLLTGVFLRYWTLWLIRGYKGGTRPLYSHGPFLLHRHPYQAGLFLIASGISLLLSGHWLSLAVTFTLLGSALHYVMGLEEQHLRSHYGEIYEYWCRHRFRIFPFIY